MVRAMKRRRDLGATWALPELDPWPVEAGFLLPSTFSDDSCAPFAGSDLDRDPLVEYPLPFLPRYGGPVAARLQGAISRADGTEAPAISQEASTGRRQG
jgi:hypothetical protein